MKAASIVERGNVELKEVPIPVIGAREILVRMRVCGICGTDIEKVHGHNITSPILGHEVAGEVVDVGCQVTDFAKGDRIIAHHHVSCRRCFYCKNGLETLCEYYPKSNLDPCGFAEFFRIPQALVNGGAVYKLPESVTFEEGSQVEPTACCIRGLRKTGIDPGTSAAVFGVGPVGLSYVQLLKLHGASPICAVDLIEERLQAAKRLGAEVTLTPTDDNPVEAIGAATDGRGVDHAIVATSNPKAIEQAVRSVRKGGHVLLFGVPARGSSLLVDLDDLFLREVSLQSSYSTSETEMRIALEMIKAGRFQSSSIITHRLELNKISEAFRLAESGSQVLKVVVHN